MSDENKDRQMMGEEMLQAIGWVKESQVKTICDNLSLTRCEFCQGRGFVYSMPDSAYEVLAVVAEKSWGDAETMLKRRHSTSILVCPYCLGKGWAKAAETEEKT